MGVHVCGLAADGAHRVAVVAVFEEDGRVFLERGELLRGARTLAIVVYAFADGEVLIFAADDGTEGDRGDNYNLSTSRSVSAQRGTYHSSQVRTSGPLLGWCPECTQTPHHLHHPRYLE